MTNRISMEQFADETGRNISVSDFSLRQVLAVGCFEGAEDDKPVWTIIFSGNGKLHNYDPTISAPTYIVGSQLNLVVLGGHSAINGAAQTELRFGLNPVYLNPLEYAMEDPVVTDGKVVFAQRSRANL